MDNYVQIQHDIIMLKEIKYGAFNLQKESCNSEDIKVPSQCFLVGHKFLIHLS